MAETITINATGIDTSVYSVIEQEVELGSQALARGDADMAAALFRSARLKLHVGQPFYGHLTQNLLLSYKMLTGQLLASGDAVNAVEILKSAMQIDVINEMSGDDQLCLQAAETIQGIGLSFFKFRRFDESILCFRRSLSINRSPGFHVNLTNALAASGRRAELSDFTVDLAREQLGRHIFIACVPKSASTFLKNLLIGITGYKDVFMVYAPGQNEHDLYLPTVMNNAAADSVTQQHCRASDANVQLMQAFEIRPVVLVRNIYDSVISLLDFYNSGASFSSFFREDFLSLDDETKIDLLIDNVIPWYFQFVASWSLVEKQRRLEIFWLNYEEFVADKPLSIENILRFYGLGAPMHGINRTIKETESDARGNRFNKGVAGRGKVKLSETQKERIQSFARYFPSTDFGRIGL